MSATWHIQKNNQTIGPFSAQQLRELALAGKLCGDDLLRKGDAGQFTAASRIKNLFAEDQVVSRHVPPPPRLPPHSARNNEDAFSVESFDDINWRTNSTISTVAHRWRKASTVTTKLEYQRDSLLTGAMWKQTLARRSKWIWTGVSLGVFILLSIALPQQKERSPGAWSSGGDKSHIREGSAESPRYRSIETGSESDSRFGWMKDEKYDPSWMKDGKYDPPWMKDGKYDPPWMKDGKYDPPWMKDGKYDPSR